MSARTQFRSARAQEKAPRPIYDAPGRRFERERTGTSPATLAAPGLPWVLSLRRFSHLRQRFAGAGAVVLNGRPFCFFAQHAAMPLRKKWATLVLTGPQPAASGARDDAGNGPSACFGNASSPSGAAAPSLVSLGKRSRRVRVQKTCQPQSVPSQHKDTNRTEGERSRETAERRCYGSDSQVTFEF